MNSENFVLVTDGWFDGERHHPQTTSFFIEQGRIAAIEEGDDVYKVIRERCIGCGLCVTTCPTNAIKLINKQ